MEKPSIEGTRYDQLIALAFWYDLVDGNLAALFLNSFYDQAVMDIYTRRD
jgi:hypothetical protein